jgi:hypothetical protein
MSGRRKRLVRLVVALPLLAALGLPGAPVHAASCDFVLGFERLHALIPDVIGDCVVDEHHDPTSGDGVQETTRGLLVWRKADNWTAFTDGATTWINGPFGLEHRPNSQRFLWEMDG